MSVKGELSHLFDTMVVANVSIDVTLVEEIIDSNKTKTDQGMQVMVISRAFGQIQVFDQILGGYS
jgi:hypothetical protein